MIQKSAARLTTDAQYLPLAYFQRWHGSDASRETKIFYYDVYSVSSSSPWVTWTSVAASVSSSGANFISLENRIWSLRIPRFERAVAGNGRISIFSPPA